MADKNPVQSAGRIFSVLEHLAVKGPMGVTEIGNELQLNKSTVHRLLASLISMGYAQKDEKAEKYFLTLKIVKLADAILSHTEIVELAHPFLKELSDKACETVHMVQREGDRIVYIDKVEHHTSSSIRMVSRIGLSYPIFTTGVGKAILANLPIQEIDKLWSSYIPQKNTEHTIVNYEKFLGELTLTKERGYALDNEENELGVRCIAGAIFDHKGTCEYAFSISAPLSRMSDQRVIELSTLILEYSRKISMAYGYML